VPLQRGVKSSSPRTSWDGVVSSTPPKLVIIEGESGIGKTRLLQAAERAAACESTFECFSTAFSTRREAGAYTRPLLSST
jgi:predicted ATP-dependent serine protease